jgi:hypothetical protein
MDVESDTRIPAFVKTYADALLRLQKHGGHIPGWVDSRRETSGWLTKSAESGAHLLFLSLLQLLEPHANYERGARRLANFVIRELLPHAAWETTESFHGHEWLWRKRRPRSEAATPDPRCNLAAWWAAEGLRTLALATGTQRYRLSGERVLGHLLLTQQLWDPPFIPAPCFGGFAAASNELRWLDCVGAFIAKTLLDYYVPSGLSEYFHRGVAALRAAAATVYCREHPHTLDLYAGPMAQRGRVAPAVQPGQPDARRVSIAPPAYDGIAATGAVAAAIEQVWHSYGDLYIDTRRVQAFGINGVTIEKVQSDLAGTAVSACEALGKPRDIMVRTDTGVAFPVNLKAGARFEVQV